MSTSGHPNPNVRFDIGGWISGPMLSEPLPDPVPVRPVPPGSSAAWARDHQGRADVPANLP